MTAYPATPADLPGPLPPGLARRWERHQRRQMRREARRAYWAQRGGHPLRGWRLPAMILGFIAWWPIGLALLAFFLWRPAMTCNANWMSPWKERMREAAERAAGRSSRLAPTGNLAFDDYRAGVLKRLEEERRKLDAEAAEFAEFLTQLRRAKDQEEFDRFMAGRSPG